MAMDPKVKQTIVIAGVATLTVVGVQSVTGAILGPRASVRSPGVQSVTRPNRER